MFAVTQLTAPTAHHLTPDGVARSVIVGWLIWWAWTQFTWTLNPADATHHQVRIVTLAAIVMLVPLAAVSSMAPVWSLAVVAVALLAIVVVEGDGPRRRARHVPTGL